MDILRSSSNSSIQDREKEALAAIFGDALQFPESEDRLKSKFYITLVPHPGVPEDNHSTVKMLVTLPPFYPGESPIIDFEVVKGLTTREASELKNLVRTKLDTELGAQNREIIYDVTQIVEEFLQQHNTPDQSLHDKMIAEQKANERKAREKLMNKAKQDREDAFNFERNYQQSRLLSLEVTGDDEDDGPIDEIVAMGREVSRAMSKFNQRRPKTPTKPLNSALQANNQSNINTRKNTNTQAAVNTTQIKNTSKSSSKTSSNAIGHKSTESDRDKQLVFTKISGHEEEDVEDEEFDDFDEQFGSDESEEGEHRITQKSTKMSTAKDSLRNNPIIPSSSTPSGLSDLIRQKNPLFHQTNTFFESPVGFDWKDAHDAEEDDFSFGDDDTDEDEGDFDESFGSHEQTGSHSKHQPSTFKDSTEISKSGSAELKNPGKPKMDSISPKIPLRHIREQNVHSPFCKLYKAINSLNQKTVIVKVYTLPKMDETRRINLFDYRTFIEKAARLLNHEGIARYVGSDYDEATNELRVIREFVSGSLTSGAVRTFDESKIRVYLRQMIKTVTFLHSTKIVGLNLKVSNMLIDNQGYLKISDFMENRLLREILNAKHSNNNANWWAPEVKQQPIIDRDQDMVDIGITFLELATGTRNENQTLPANFSAVAKDFVQLCLSKSASSIMELSEHPFIRGHGPTSESSCFMDEDTQGEFVPLSPASSVAGFSLYPPIKDSDITDSGEFPLPQHPNNHSTWSGSTSSNQVSSSSNSIPPLKSSQPPSLPSRYRTDFEELEILGKGGFGQVVKVKNRLDGQIYAIKKIRFGRTDENFLEKLKREVMTLSRLYHPHVVRYYHSWIDEADDMDLEQMNGDEEEEEEEEESEQIEQSEINNLNHNNVQAESEDSESSRNQSLVLEDQDLFGSVSGTTFDETLTFDEQRFGAEPGKSIRPKRGSQLGKPIPKRILYIQMEYCTEKTLRDLIDAHSLSDEVKWKLFRQLVEGLHHIHTQGIIHRDLKPTNVFLDSSGDIKIGDFGLAVSSTQGPSTTTTIVGINALANSRPNKPTSAMDLTAGVGTPLYLSPEQDRGGAVYNQKVDIYSLGIIFFELFHAFKTAMERYKVITDLRKKEIRVPPSWEKDPKVKIVRWLLDHDPEERPSTLTLLQSDLLPAKLEDEDLKEAMRTITNPNTTVYSLLLKKLFSSAHSPSMEISYDTDALKHPYEAVVREIIQRRMVRIFEIHSADCVEPPAYFPKPSLVLHQQSVQMLDSKGTVICFPFDLTMPFARYVARKKIRSMRRYVFGKVYRPTTGQPREMRECDFDIVGSSRNRLALTCEVVQVLIELLNEFKEELGRSIIRFNNYKILNAIVKKISEKPETQRKIRGGLALFWKKHSVKETERMLLTIEGISQSSLDAAKIDSLLHICKDFTMPAVDMLNKLENLYTRDKDIIEAIKETKSFLHYAELFRISSHLRFDATLIYNYEYYYDIVFQGFLMAGEAIAVGGCYDELVEHFASLDQDTSSAATSSMTSHWAAGGGGRGSYGGAFALPINRRTTDRSAVGMSIAIDVLVARIWEYQRNSEKEKFIPHTAAQIIVYYHFKSQPNAETALSALEERIQVAQLLWRNGLRADYCYDENWTIEQITRDCEQKGIQWIIILKESRNMSLTAMVGRKTPIRIKDVRSRTEASTTLGELIPFFISKHLRNPNLIASCDSNPDSVGLIPASSGGVSSSSSTSSMMGTSIPMVSINTRGGPVMRLNKTGSGAAVAESPPGSDAVPFIRTAEPESLDVEILGPLRQEKGSKGKKDIVRSAMEKISVGLKNFAPRPIVKVGAIDVPLSSIREILVVLESNGESQSIERKLGKLKDRFGPIREYWIKVRREKHPYVFFYSTIDDEYHVSFLKK